MANTNVKIITKGWIYNKANGYTKAVVDAIKTAERINKNSDEFVEDVALMLKRSSAPAYLLKVLNSANTVLYKPKTRLPKCLRVICAKDLKEGSSTIKVYIDITDIITRNENTKRYKVQTDILIAYLIAAKTQMVYYKIPNAFRKGDYMAKAAKLYAKLFTHIVDYLGNISVVPENKNTMMYLAAKFFLHNVLGYDNEERVTDIAVDVADITTTQANIMNLSVGRSMANIDIKDMIEIVKKVYKLDKLTTSLFVSKWMYLYGPGTVLGIEFFPAFIQIITDAYVGVYLNNQKTIEKILGKDMVEFGKLNIYNNNGIM